MNEEPVRIAAAVIVRADGKTLLVRKRGTIAFMQPGGKIAAGETGVAALARELQEELGCGIAPSPHNLGRFTAPAANEAGRIVEAELFLVEPVCEIGIAAEIDELLWLDPHSTASIPLAPLTQNHVLPLVRAHRRAT